MIKKISFKQITLISLAFHIIIALFSSGFHHFDEHFQIYEFLYFKLGGIGQDQLPWEFRDMIRPWGQVFIYYLIAAPLKAFGLFNPFYTAALLRLFTSVLGWGALVYSLKLIKHFIDEEYWQKLSYLIIHFSWFVPYIQTRTNAESFTISFMLFGMTLFLTQKESLKAMLLASFFLGASYLFRYQSAIMVATLWFWAAFIGKYSLKSLSSFACGILAMIGLGVVVDFWGYGQWTFSPWNLIYMDFFKGVLKATGESPWWEYLRTSFNRGIPPLSLIFLLGTLYFWIKKYKHPLTWLTLPFFLIHCYIGHKELRYIFPVIIISTYMLGIICFENRSKILSFIKTRKSNFIIRPILGLNFLLLLVTLFRPANPSVNFFKYIYDNNISSFYFVGESPYTMVSLPINYYKKESTTLTQIESIDQVIEEKAPFYLFHRKGEMIDKMKAYPQCERKYLTYPAWTLNFNIGNWISRSRVWSLYFCQTTSK